MATFVLVIGRPIAQVPLKRLSNRRRKKEDKLSLKRSSSMKKIRSNKPLGKAGAKEGASDNGLEAEKARLREKDPAEWTVSDVGKWLDCIDMGQYKIVFIENR